MKKLVIIAAILLLSTMAFAQTADWFTGSFEDAKAMARKDQKPILIDFFSDG